ncbi:MAG: tetratricopeptide repeat protein [Candidatus Gastranaerophilales bacterium]|nr:tetratricopeptide repeat protein [Candidatus Gastranaerophilales bacterium]
MLKEKSKFPQKEDDIIMTNAQKTLEKAVEAHQRYLLKSTNEDLTTAINCYIESIKENPDQSSAYYRLATLLHKNGQIGVENAIEQCHRAIELNPTDANAHMYLGYFLSLNQQFDEAKKEFKEAIKLKPSTSRTRLVLALTCLEKIRNATCKKSIKDYTNALYYGLTGTLMSVFDTASIKMFCQNLADDLNFAKYKAVGDFYEKINSEKKAYNIYLSAVDNSKKSIALYERMAKIAIKKNRHDIAFDCLNNIVILSNNDPMKVVDAIEYVEQYQSDRINELIDYYTILANKYPEFSKCYYELGHLYLKKDEKINALSAFKLALKYDNDNPYYQNSLAYAYVQLEQYDSAIELYKKALEANPNDEWSAVVAQALAAIYHQVKGNSDAAISMLENSLLLTKNKSQIYEAIADIYYDIESLDHAIEYYQMALRDDSENPKIYSRLAMANWEKDCIEKAIIFYSKAIELDSTYDIAYNNLGVVFLDGLGDATRAIDYFRTAIEINPNYVLAHFNLARSYETMNEKINAAKQYQKALNLNKTINELDNQIIEERLYRLFEA